ncbi:hypothetical protein, partial [Pyxidicoccus fallax]|uniref:hypothetical protein n=1 Tax=Pyxidicoccus fallax TaxID=394095 RepID=UPI001B7D48E1
MRVEQRRVGVTRPVGSAPARGASGGSTTSAVKSEAVPSPQSQVKTSNVVFPQTTKPAGEGDSVLDGNVLARHHDALDEQAYQPLPALE